MFQAVKPEEIFDRSYWQVPETHPAYWLAQLRRKEWIRLLFPAFPISSVSSI